MGALMRCIPKEMWATLGTKKTVKEAWETMNTMQLFADLVKDVNAQRLLKEFKNIGFKEGQISPCASTIPSQTSILLERQWTSLAL